MELKQVLVYDNQHGFSWFLKKVWKKNDFKVYKKFNLINDFYTTKIDYSFIFLEFIPRMIYQILLQYSKSNFLLLFVVLKRYSIRLILRKNYFLLISLNLKKN